MVDDAYFTVSFELGKVVVFKGADGRITGVTFDLDGSYGERPSGGAEAEKIALYLGGFPVSLDFHVDLSGESPFKDRVYRRVSEIPYGQTATYGVIASDIGCPGGARAVGQAMASNRFPLIIPCHRVLSSHGGLGGFSSGLGLKMHLLHLEGVIC